jgi:hypothetical protein
MKTANKPGVNTLRHQFKLYQGDFPGTKYADPKTFGNDYSFTNSPQLD